MNTHQIDLRLFYSIALQVIKVLGERHQGRLGYISPEQTGRMKRSIDQRSDLYVVGVLLYELLTGELPFKAVTMNDWIHAHMAVFPVPPRTVRPEIPQLLSDLVMKLLSKSVEYRYQSFFGLLDDLSNAQRNGRTQERSIPFMLGELDTRGRFRFPEKLYSREQQLQKLVQAYDRSCLGTKQLWFIGGHAGSGKSKLVYAVRSHVMQTKGHFIIGKCDLLQQIKPYSFLIAAIRDLIRQIVAGGEERLAKWRKKLLWALGQVAASSSK